MQCPKCRSRMEVTELDEIEIDRCTSCGGLWFQPEELSALRSDAYRAPFALDTGSSKLGRMHNQAQSAACPQCGVEMDQQRDPEQKHILYESCPEGHGVFLDAGEFTDLARKTLWDKFKPLR